MSEPTEEPPQHPKGGFRVKRHPAHVEEGEAWLISYADLMTLLVGFFLILQTFSEIKQDDFEKVKKATSEVFGGEYQVPYQDLADQLKKELEKSGFADQVILKQTEVGIDISFRGALFFDSGSAELKPEALTLLGTVTPILQEHREFQFVVEGHTDDVPISTIGFRNNWELSSIRASRVLAYFEQRGTPRSDLMALGYADTKPLAKNRDAAGNAISENQSQNRRVVIKAIKRNEVVVGNVDNPPR